MTRELRALHIASGDLWAGAELQAFTLMSHLARMPDVKVAAILLNEGTMADKVRSAGIPLYIADERKIGSLRIFSEVRRVLNVWRPDVLHTHREKENILGSLANRWCHAIPSVRTVHGGREHSGAWGWRSARHRMVHEVDLWCGRRLQQKIIAVSKDLGARLAREFSAEKVVVIENGIDAEVVRAGKGLAEFRSANADSTHVGIVGRLVPVKRVDIFIETASVLRRDHPERRWEFHVFGDGPMRAELERLSEHRGLAERLSFHGHRPDIATCIAGLDVLVICSDHEGMPMAALEAAALSVPTVAHAVGGLSDLVPEEFLVARHDARGYSDGILRALRDDGAGITERRACTMLPRFSARVNAERVHALYKQIVAACNGA